MSRCPECEMDLEVEGYDLEVLEVHHKHKVDAHSGTALALGEALARARAEGKPEEGLAFAKKLNAIPISFTEFAPVARDYPIVFTTLDGGKSFAPVIVLGLSDGSNLFLDTAGEWDAATYLPAFVRRLQRHRPLLQIGRHGAGGVEVEVVLQANPHVPAPEDGGHVDGQLQ